MNKCLLKGVPEEKCSGDILYYAPFRSDYVAIRCEKHFELHHSPEFRSSVTTFSSWEELEAHRIIEE
jgi:hypothetical protein